MLCFPEPVWPSLAAAAAAGTCGEVGGELGDLLSDALGLADRFSGCAPSLSCKNQNSTVWPAVTTVKEFGGTMPRSFLDKVTRFQKKCGVHAEWNTSSLDQVHATAHASVLPTVKKIKTKEEENH